MVYHDQLTRRRTLKVAGATTAAVLLAGCPDDDDDAAGPPADDEDDVNDVDDDDEVDDEDDVDDDEDDNDENGFSIEPDTQIEFDAQSSGWIGIAPDDIEGEENPTLVLEEGESYEIGWTEGDGATHNIEIRDEDGEVVDDLETDFADEPNDDQWLEFEASDEMAAYVCAPHENAMNGEIEIE